MKLLAIQFKSLGDAVLLIPALEAIRAQYPDCELHALVSEAAAPLLQRQPCLTRVWAFPRDRGRPQIRRSLPLLRALRAQRFDRSVDFVGNDRGAILSWLCGARNRLGVYSAGGFLGRRFCYTCRVPEAPLDCHESARSCGVLSAWGITPPRATEIKLYPDPLLVGMTAELLPKEAIVCHIGAAISKKEWPISNWVSLYRLATAAGHRMVFSACMNSHEERAQAQLKQLIPDARFLPRLELPQFLAVLKHSRAMVSSDTGPMHFAAGLGVPTVALFGPTSPTQWAPLGEKHRIICAKGCVCPRKFHDCQSASHCMNNITPEDVLEQLQGLLQDQFVQP